MTAIACQEVASPIEFGCAACGSPAILFPDHLSAQALVVCDRCRVPLATLAEFRERVERIATVGSINPFKLIDRHIIAEGDQVIHK